MVGCKGASTEPADRDETASRPSDILSVAAIGCAHPRPPDPVGRSQDNATPVRRPANFPDGHELGRAPSDAGQEHIPAEVQSLRTPCHTVWLREDGVAAADRDEPLAGPGDISQTGRSGRAPVGPY